MSDVVIRVENISKLYRLGEVGTGSLAHDVNRWWHRVRVKEDPYLKIGEVNDRTKSVSGKKKRSLTTEDTESTTERLGRGEEEQTKFGPKGEGAGAGPDCSCGCNFFLKLPGQLGNDWGVCWNPESLRSGLLTFEHQGCRHFVEEEELWDEDE